MRLAVYFAGNWSYLLEDKWSLGLDSLAGGTLRSDRAVSVKTVIADAYKGRISYPWHLDLRVNGPAKHAFGIAPLRR